MGSVGPQSECVQLFQIRRLNLRGVSEMTERVCSALMYCTWEALTDSVSLDTGQIMCYSSQQWTLFGELTFLSMFPGDKQAERVKHTRISVLIDKISTCTGHIWAVVLWNKPASLCLFFSHF